VAEPDFERAEDDEAEEIPQFRINPVHSYERRYRESYMPREHIYLRSQYSPVVDSPMIPRDDNLAAIKEGEYKGFL